MFRALLQTCALLLLWTAQVAAHAQTVNWVTWTNPGSYPSNNPAPNYNYTNSASGSLTLPDNTVVTVTLTGEVTQYSCFTTTITACPNGYWRNIGGWGGTTYAPAGTYTSANVPSLPTNANMIAQAGHVPAVARHTLTFSQPVTNIVMPVFSLGGGAGLSAYRFDQDFTLLSQSPKCTNPTSGTNPAWECLSVQGRTLTGNEGAGTVQFTGTVTSISWEVTVAEVYSGFNVGVTSASFTSQTPLTLAASTSHILAANNTSTLSTSGGSGTGATSYTVLSGPCTVSGNTLTGTSAGTCRVTATKAGDGTYASTTSNMVTVAVVNPLYVTYDGNGQTYGAPPTDSGSYSIGDTVTLLGQNFQQRTGYTFNGWNTAANGSGTSYAAGGTFNIAASTTLYAQWLAPVSATATQSIPTLSEWGLVLLSLAAAALGMRATRRRV